ncbi:MAG: hypothetical protein EZS28_050600, partial [Streblomastix strix]
AAALNARDEAVQMMKQVIQYLDNRPVHCGPIRQGILNKTHKSQVQLDSKCPSSEKSIEILTILIPAFDNPIQDISISVNQRLIDDIFSLITSGYTQRIRELSIRFFSEIQRLRGDIVICDILDLGVQQVLLKIIGTETVIHNLIICINFILSLFRNLNGISLQQGFRAYKIHFANQIEFQGTKAELDLGSFHCDQQVRRMSKNAHKILQLLSIR